LAIYWILVKLVPVPGYGAGILEPQGSLSWYIDSTLLAGHTWSGAPAPGFDPEGILSTLPAICTVMFGIFAGDWLRSKRDHYEKVSGLFVAGIIGLVLGEILKGWLPINKNLWTSTYSIFMAGMALIFLAMSYWFIDIKGFKSWAKPSIVFGSNAILVYSLSSLIAKTTISIKWLQADGTEIMLKTYLYKNLFASWAGVNEFSSLLYPITYILIWLGIMWILYRKNIFVKI
jgi:predicted acyltransferase